MQGQQQTCGKEILDEVRDVIRLHTTMGTNLPPVDGNLTQ